MHKPLYFLGYLEELQQGGHPEANATLAPYLDYLTVHGTRIITTYLASMHDHTKTLKSEQTTKSS